MDSVLVPEEAANHLGAVLLAFNRSISASLLDEAGELVNSGQTAAAVLIAGTVLEYVERSPASTLVPPAHKRELDSWRQLRDEVAHGSAVTLSAEQARQMIESVRQIVSIHKAPPSASVQQARAHIAEAAARIKGKYAHVPTSSDEFIRRKREELDLEDRE